jgi:hypothetical protein
VWNLNPSYFVISTSLKGKVHSQFIEKQEETNNMQSGPGHFSHDQANVNYAQRSKELMHEQQLVYPMATHANTRTPFTTHGNCVQRIVQI